MNVYGGLSGKSAVGGWGKERLLQGRGSQYNTCIIWRQHNESHQTLFEKGRGNGNIMEGMNLFKVPWMYIITTKKSLVSLMYANSKSF
jgi:hypothetical protein